MFFRRPVDNLIAGRERVCVAVCMGECVWMSVCVGVFICMSKCVSVYVSVCGVYVRWYVCV